MRPAGRSAGDQPPSGLPCGEQPFRDWPRSGRLPRGRHEIGRPSPLPGHPIRSTSCVARERSPIPAERFLRAPVPQCRSRNEKFFGFHVHLPNSPMERQPPKLNQASVDPQDPTKKASSLPVSRRGPAAGSWISHGNLASMARQYASSGFCGSRHPVRLGKGAGASHVRVHPSILRMGTGARFRWFARDLRRHNSIGDAGQGSPLAFAIRGRVFCGMGLGPTFGPTRSATSRCYSNGGTARRETRSALVPVCLLVRSISIGNLEILSLFLVHHQAFCERPSRLGLSFQVMGADPAKVNRIGKDVDAFVETCIRLGLRETDAPTGGQLSDRVGHAAGRAMAFQRE
jgi:hypothetical protein